MTTEIHGIKFYTIPETAKVFNVTPATVRLWIKKGRLGGQRIGRPILVTEEDINTFLKDRK